MSDRRTKERMRILLRAQYNKPYETAHYCTIKEVSEIGMKIYTDRPIEEYSEIELSITLPSESLPLTGAGEVMWVKRIAEYVYCAGISLKECNDILDPHILDNAEIIA